MYVPAQGLSHLPSTNVGDRMQCQTVEELVHVEKVFSYAVDDQGQQLVLFMQEEGHGEISNLLLGVLVRGDEVDSFEMTEADIPAEDVYVQELGPAVSGLSSIVNLAFLHVPCRHISSCGIRSGCHLRQVSTARASRSWIDEIMGRQPLNF